jgi:Transposase C of IS166 homeodomain
MTERIGPIPDDLTTCQEQLRAVLARLYDLERQLDETCTTTEELQRSYACLKEEYLALKRLFFGPRRERLPEVPGQQQVFEGDAPRSVPEEPSDAFAADDLFRRKHRKGHGRRGISDDLLRREKLHDVAAEEKVCGCGRDKARIGEDVTEQLD